MVSLGGKLPGSGRVNLLVPRCNSVRFGRVVSSAGIGPERDVLVSERIWSDWRSGDELGLEEKKERLEDNG